MLPCPSPDWKLPESGSLAPALSGAKALTPPFKPQAPPLANRGPASTPPTLPAAPGPAPGPCAAPRFHPSAAPSPGQRRGSAPPRHGAGGERGGRAPAAEFRAPLPGSAHTALFPLAGGRWGARREGDRRQWRGEGWAGSGAGPVPPPRHVMFSAPSLDPAARPVLGPRAPPGARAGGGQQETHLRESGGPSLHSAFCSLFPWPFPPLAAFAQSPRIQEMRGFLPLLFVTLGLGRTIHDKFHYFFCLASCYSSHCCCPFFF